MSIVLVGYCFPFDKTKLREAREHFGWDSVLRDPEKQGMYIAIESMEGDKGYCSVNIQFAALEDFRDKVEAFMGREYTQQWGDFGLHKFY